MFCGPHRLDPRTLWVVSADLKLKTAALNHECMGEIRDVRLNCFYIYYFSTGTILLN